MLRNEQERRNEERELVYEISWIPELSTWRRFCGHNGANEHRSRSRSERCGDVLVTLPLQRVGPYNSPHCLREGEDHREGVMAGVGHGAVNFRMEGVVWSSREDPVDDFWKRECEGVVGEWLF